ncbi:MAG TPA: hypothetical protein VMT60_03295, partial [Candidatus Bathyarchaeia archaeon]|nr:hypothetical protein [Candidatus Bathyarchaeia archaeon]
RYRLTFPVETNIVIFEPVDAGAGVAALGAALERAGILAHPFDDRHIRMVTHLDIRGEDMERIVRVLPGILAA